MTTTPTLPPLLDGLCFLHPDLSKLVRAYALSAHQAGQADLHQLIANDAYAASFQTMGQYRQALLRIMAAGGKNMTGSNKQSEILK